MKTLQYIAKKLMMKGKGILAADESTSTCDKRFDEYGIPKDPETRRKWRELLLTTPKIERWLSGVILFDETIRQEIAAGEPFAKYLAGRGILPGIKVDQKTEPFAGSSAEKVTKGLDGLRERLAEYVKFGAAFTKWRAVIRIGKELPTSACIKENAKRIAEYALASQRAGLVPIVEPEVLLDGTHTLSRSGEVIAETHKEVFAVLREVGADLNGLLLKSSMALPGNRSGEKVSTGKVAAVTFNALIASVPPEVPGVLFLSGGQTPDEATDRLDAIVLAGRKAKAPWPLSFSFSRALQDPVMEAWLGKEEHVKKAQAIFAKRVAQTALASEGRL